LQLEVLYDSVGLLATAVTISDFQVACMMLGTTKGNEVRIVFVEFGGLAKPGKCYLPTCQVVTTCVASQLCKWADEIGRIQKASHNVSS
jgi:hypothetical protein